jgi:hypothetical protein
MALSPSPRILLKNRRQARVSALADPVFAPHVSAVYAEIISSIITGGEAVTPRLQAPLQDSGHALNSAL